MEYTIREVPILYFYDINSNELIGSFKNLVSFKEYYNKYLVNSYVLHCENICIDWDLIQKLKDIEFFNIRTVSTYKALPDGKEAEKVFMYTNCSLLEYCHQETSEEDPSKIDFEFDALDMYEVKE